MNSQEPHLFGAGGKFEGGVCLLGLAGCGRYVSDDADASALAGHARLQ